jgi:hypothetical protein
MKKLILILTMFSSLTSYNVSRAQERTIKGTVTDKKTGTPMVGAYVSAEDSKGVLKVKASVAQNGSYSIKVEDNVKELVFSYISYITVKVKIGKSNVINVKMEESQNSLREEVVIRGYAKSGKDGRSFVASEKVAQNYPVAQVEQLLKGKVAGMNIKKPRSTRFERLN